MSDRAKGLVVVFDRDLSGEEVDVLINAINTFRGVLTVRPLRTEAGDIVNRARVAESVQEALLHVLDNVRCGRRWYTRKKDSDAD